ncbi:MAG TPA: NADH-quinone oxidoreductase subunit NuoE [Firmicutes bacterium]|nr:NADH-quinone oxidoreductase subunit NuoE [Bacillota bacterium]
MLRENLKAEIESLIAMYPERRAALIMALHAVQRDKGFLSPGDFSELAEIFDEHPAEIQSVASFYEMFRQKPAGKNIIAVCTNISCMLNGSDEIVGHLKKVLGIDFGETTSDGMFTLMKSECLAACDMAPAIAINGEYFGPVTPEIIDRLLDERRDIRDKNDL